MCEIRAAKVEEEAADLVKKVQQLEMELDKTKEELMTTTEKLKEKERALLASELSKPWRQKKLDKAARRSWRRSCRLLLLISSPWKSLRRKPTSEWRFTRSRSRLSQLS